MTKYIRTYPNCEKENFIKHFSNKLDISFHNTEMILIGLIESKVVQITQDRRLKYENTRN